jgi:hypothetical protein
MSDGVDPEAILKLAFTRRADGMGFLADFPALRTAHYRHTPMLLGLFEHDLHPNLARDFSVTGERWRKGLSRDKDRDTPAT